MPNYETISKKEAVEYLRTLTPQTRIRGERAVKDLLEGGKDWEWINTALRKKDQTNWERYGFGLLWNNRYQGFVRVEIERQRELRKRNIKDTDAWLDSLEREASIEKFEQEKANREEFKNLMSSIGNPGSKVEHVDVGGFQF